MRPVIALVLLALVLLALVLPAGCASDERPAADDRTAADDRPESDARTEPARELCPSDEPARSPRGGAFIIDGPDLAALDGPLLCRYELDWDGESGGTYLLVDHAALTELELSRVADAIKAAPLVGESERDCAEGPGVKFAIYTSDNSTTIYHARCGHQGVRSGDPKLAYRATPQEAVDVLDSV